MTKRIQMGHRRRAPVAHQQVHSSVVISSEGGQAEEGGIQGTEDLERRHRRRDMEHRSRRVDRHRDLSHLEMECSAEVEEKVVEAGQVAERAGQPPANHLHHLGVAPEAAEPALYQAEVLLHAAA